jgi:hypothetical protein
MSFKDQLCLPCNTIIYQTLHERLAFSLRAQLPVWLPGGAPRLDLQPAHLPGVGLTALPLTLLPFFPHSSPTEATFDRPTTTLSLQSDHVNRC